MHGRLKVKTSAQEQEEKRKERERKLKIYRSGFEIVFSKRVSGELDGEILQITEQLLIGNPDIYTLWNIRREVLQIFRISKSVELFDSDLKEELRVSEAALKCNPKSYGAWNHRIWVLESMGNPPVSQELNLCCRLLKVDPRNFHCWDYRRWLAFYKAQENNYEGELEFSLEKLNENFSNYSAWHYRTLFLPCVHSDRDSPCSVTAEQHKRELSLVQNAVFTDPGDQSAWFYLCWLLGKKKSYSKPQIRMGLLQCKYGSYSAALVLNVPRESGEELQAMLTIGKKHLKGKWKCNTSLKVSYLWTFVPDEADADITEALEMADQEGPSIVLTDSGEEIDHICLKKVSSGKENVLEWVAIEFIEDEGKSLLLSILKEQLHLCIQLLELEPDSRWALLTAVQLMRTLKMRQPVSKINDYDDKIIQYLDKLVAIDPYRSGYYDDIRSDCCLESALHKDKKISSVIDLSSLQLTAFPFPSASFPISLLSATELDLSCNSAFSLPLEKPGILDGLAHLPRLRCLRITASFSKLEYHLTSHNFLPHLPNLFQLELVPDGDPGVTLSKEVVHFMFKIIPSLRVLKPI